MFLSIINSIINSAFFWITSAVISAFYCGWYAKKHDDSWGEWFVLGAFYPFFISIPNDTGCPVQPFSTVDPPKPNLTQRFLRREKNGNILALSV